LLSKFNPVYTAFVPEPPGRVMKGRKMGWQKDEEQNELCFNIFAIECFCLKNGSGFAGLGIQRKGAELREVKYIKKSSFRFQISSLTIPSP